jgi:hypothetical protein
LIPPGTPTIYLQHIALHVSWCIPQPIPQFARRQKSADSSKEGAGDDGESQAIEQGEEALVVEGDEGEEEYLLESDVEESQEVLVDEDDLVLEEEGDEQRGPSFRYTFVGLADSWHRFPRTAR